MASRYFVRSGDLNTEISSNSHHQAIVDAFKICGTIKLGALTSVLLNGDALEKTLFFSTAKFLEPPKIKLKILK